MTYTYDKELLDQARILKEHPDVVTVREQLKLIIEHRQSVVICHRWIDDYTYYEFTNADQAYEWIKTNTYNRILTLNVGERTEINVLSIDQFTVIRTKGKKGDLTYDVNDRKDTER